VNLNSGCDPNTNQSIACHAWAYDVGQVRTKSIDALTNKADDEMLAGYLLFLLGDALNFWRGTILDKIDAVLDALTTILNSIIPLVGHRFGGSVYEAALRFSSWAMGVMAVVQTVIGALKSASYWVEHAAEFTANLIVASAGGPVGIFVQGLMMVAKPVVGYLIDAGGHYLQSLAFADYAEAARESDMPLQDWCIQYGGCPSYSSYH